MGVPVCMGAMLTCSFGAAPSALVVIRPKILTAAMPAANIMDHAPLANILPFGVCTSLANPTVAAATAAALGVLTPMPCIPATPAPWLPGKPTLLVGSLPMLDSDSKLTCMWGGVIAFTTPGQFVAM